MTGVVSRRLAWGDPVAAPAVLEFLWAYPMQGMRPYLGEMVGLFGAMEIGFDSGPLLMDDYHLTSKVLCGSAANRIRWYEARAFDPQG